MDLARLILLLFSINKASSLSLPVLNEHELTAMKESQSGGAVMFIYSGGSDRAVKQSLHALENASDVLRKHGTNLGVVNCKDLDVCKSYTSSDSLIVFRSGKVLSDFNLEAISTTQEAEGKILFWLNEDVLSNIESKDDWMKFEDSVAGNKNFVFVYLNKLGTKFQGFVQKKAIEFKSDLKFAHTSNIDLAKQVTSSEYIDRSGAMWISMCSAGKVEGKCPILRVQHIFSSEYLSKLWTDMIKHPLANLITGEQATKKLQTAIDAAQNTSKQVFIFIAGKRKLEKATSLAKLTCSVHYTQAECVVINGDGSLVPNNFTKADRIHLTILPKTTDNLPQETDLLSETYGEVKERLELLNSRLALPNFLGERMALRQQIQENGEDGDSEEDTSNSDIEMHQDDPVVYSVHKSKAMKDLYLFDFKTLPRLTDVTYSQLVKGSEFGVILFTLEFNSKSIAALSLYANIHKKFKASGGPSPLYRVECFDWPDICKEANVTTFPQIHFYRPNENRLPHKFSGVWKESSMTEAITLHSLPWPITGMDQEMLDILPKDFDFILGIVATNEGKTSFMDASRKNGGKFVFVLAEEDMATNVAKVMSINNWKEKNIIVKISGGNFVEQREFNSIVDIENYIQSQGENKFVEITEVNYEELMNSNKPFVIQYLNKSANQDEVQQQRKLFKYMQQLSSNKKINSEVLLTWMDSSPSSVGEYTLHLHNNEKFLTAPVVFLNKQDNYVASRSFSGKITEELILNWIFDCMKRKETTTSTLREHEWVARIAAYDVLNMMALSGILPPSSSEINNSHNKEEEEDLMDKSSSHFNSKNQTPSSEPRLDAMQHTEL